MRGASVVCPPMRWGGAGQAPRPRPAGGARSRTVSGRERLCEVAALRGAPGPSARAPPDPTSSGIRAIWCPNRRERDRAGPPPRAENGVTDRWRCREGCADPRPPGLTFSQFAVLASHLRGFGGSGRIRCGSTHLPFAGEFLQKLFQIVRMTSRVPVRPFARAAAMCKSSRFARPNPPTLLIALPVADGLCERGAFPLPGGGNSVLTERVIPAIASDTANKPEMRCRSRSKRCARRLLASGYCLSRAPYLVLSLAIRRAVRHSDLGTRSKCGGVPRSGKKGIRRLA